MSFLRNAKIHINTNQVQSFLLLYAAYSIRRHSNPVSYLGSFFLWNAGGIGKRELSYPDDADKYFFASFGKQIKRFFYIKTTIIKEIQETHKSNTVPQEKNCFPQKGGKKQNSEKEEEKKQNSGETLLKLRMSKCLLLIYSSFCF